MNELFMTSGGCLLLGVMTTLHPCPLTTNIAAISMLIGPTGSGTRKTTMLVLFSFGYVFSLLGIAALINFGLISIPRFSVFLQSILSAFFGPMLIFVGMVLSEMIHVGRPLKWISLNNEFWRKKSAGIGFPLGALLAMAFCPATAFIYFGLLIPLSVNNDQILLFPVLYAMGALLPIVGISILINQGLIHKTREKLVKKIPQIAGWILILSGIYITLEQLYF